MVLAKHLAEEMILTCTDEQKKLNTVKVILRESFRSRINRMLLKLGTENGERESGNECTVVTRLRIQNGRGNDVYKHRFYR